MLIAEDALLSTSSKLTFELRAILKERSTSIGRFSQSASFVFVRDFLFFVCHDRYHLLRRIIFGRFLFQFLFHFLEDFCFTEKTQNDEKNWS